ncbi:MAG: hypothetical protein RJB38_1571 [Pseudomonadota bacterium]|jgi:DNA-binding transcriptional LysR family regulator
MDSNRLRYFIAVAETGSIRKAAEVLRLSPAALSKAIKLLEDETNLRLLAPAGRGIVITAEGRKLAERAKPVLSELNSLSATIGQETKAAEHSVHIGSFEVFTTHFLRPLLEVLPNGVPLLLRELIPGELENALVSGEIDLGLTYIPVPTAGVEHLRVASVKMGVYGRKSYFEGVPFEEIPFAIPVQPLKGAPNKVQGLDGWPEDKVVRKVHYRVTLMESALELCRCGKAVAYLPRFVARLHNQSVHPKLKLQEFLAPKRTGLHTQPVYVVHRKDQAESPLIRHIARLLREVCSDS